MRWLLILLLIAISGCGVRPTGVISAGDPPVATQYPAATIVYFHRAGKLTPVFRPGAPGNPGIVFTYLSAGPTAQERAEGIESVIFDKRSVVDWDITGAVMNVRVSATPRNRLGLGQLVCTCGAIPPVEYVRISRAGELIANARACEDFAEFV